MAGFSYEVEIPGKGKFRVDSPSELSDDQAYRAAAGQADMQRMADPTTGMSQTDLIVAGAQQKGNDLLRGGKQILSRLPFLNQTFKPDAVQAEVDEARKLDAPLMGTTGGKVGAFATDAAAMVPTMFIPGANTYKGAALLSGLYGMLQPTSGDESRLTNTAAHGVAGIAGQGAANAVGRLIKPIQSTLPAGEQALLDAAKRNKIPVQAGQATGSRPLQIVESVMENLPFTSGPQLAIKEAQQKAFNSAVLGKAGIAADEGTAAVLLPHKQALGKEMGDIANASVLDFNRGLVDTLANIVDDAAKRMPPDKAAAVAKTVDQIFAQVDNAGAMSGANYQGWREPLRALASDSQVGRYYSQIRKALDSEFSGQIQNPAFGEASRKYANLKTILNAQGGAGATTKAGNIPPAQLEAALTQAMGREGKALGRGDLNELVAVGRKFVSDSIPNSGTAQRQLMQSLMTGGGGAGIGATGAAATGNDPMQGALYGGGITAAGLLAPRAIQGAMNSKAGQAYLTKGLANLSADEQAIIAALARAGGLGLLGYTPQQ